MKILEDIGFRDIGIVVYCNQKKEICYYIYMKYNHDRPLSDFDQQLSLISDAGFKTIAVSQMYFEDTFVFKTPEEAEKAYRMLERDTKERCIGKVVGWWYGEQDFKQEVEKYERENDGYSKVLVYWL